MLPGELVRTVGSRKRTLFSSWSGFLQPDESTKLSSADYVYVTDKEIGLIVKVLDNPRLDYCVYAVLFGEKIAIVPVESLRRVSK